MPLWMKRGEPAKAGSQKEVMMEMRYETVWIVRPDAGEDLVKGIIQKASTAVQAGGGKVNRVDEWGRRRLAYPIRKKHEGFYVIMDYVSPAEASKELERSLKYNEDVLRYQTVRVTENKAALKAAEAKKAADAKKAEAAAAKGGPAND